MKNNINLALWKHALYAFLSEANKVTKIGDGFFEFNVFEDLICIDFTFLDSHI